MDDLFKQLVTLEPYNKGLLYTLELDLTPSPGVTQSIQHKLRENELRTEAAKRGLSQPKVASVAIVVDNAVPEPPPIKRPLHPELAAISDISKSRGPRTSSESLPDSMTSSVRTPATGHAPPGRSADMVRQGVGFNNLLTNN